MTTIQLGARWACAACLLAACGQAEVGEPTWGLDVVLIDPVGPTEVRVLHTWALFDEAWGDAPSAERHVCSALFDYQGTADAEAGCGDACDHQWSLVGGLLEDDCEGGVPEAILGLEAIGVGTLDPSLRDDAERDGLRSGWMRWSGVWEVHGFAAPEGARHGRGSVGPWDGETPYELWPAFALWVGEP